MLDLRILGPVRLFYDGRELPAGPAQQRCLLAVLLTYINSVVPSARLIELIWDDRPPPSAQNVIAGYATRIRKTLLQGASGEDAPRLSAREGGYLIEADPLTVDLYRFRGLIAEAADLADDGRRLEVLHDALALWKGAPLGDSAGLRIQPLRASLESEHVAATLRYYDTLLRLGRHGEMLSGLQAFADEHPYDEDIAVRLMDTHRGAGNPPAALRQFVSIREKLGEIGTAPGPELREAINRLAHQDATGGADPAGRRPGQLLRIPPATDRFVGRAHEMRELETLVSRDDRLGASFPPVHGNLFIISGIAGAGKTALAVQWAHRIRHYFSGGQFFVNMRGHDRHLEPLTATEALAHCLIALGLPAVDIPYGLDERAALYRTLLATRPVLVILDDATVNLVRDLLPPSNCGSAVVVTCRHRMPELTAGYRAGEVVLDVLDEAAAVELLGGLIGADRVARERDGAASLARRCGNLPLALRVGAAYAAGRPDVPLARLAADIGGELRGPVDQAFDLSYQRLPPGQQRVFRLIGMIPGADFTTVAVAALAGCTSAEAEEGLNALVKANLILEYASHRYRMHDLVKLYAVARAAADDTPAEREAALLRLFHWYWQIIEQTSQAHRIQLPGIHRGPVVPKPRQPSLAGIGMNAPDVGWLDAELTNICASIKLASELGLSPIGWQLADAMLGYIRIHPGGNDWAAAVRSARGAAAKSNDHHGHAVMLLNVADAEYREGRQDTEQRYARQALEVSRKAHWPTGEALAYGTLGRSYWSTGSISLSAYYLRSALRIHQKTGDEAGQATIIGRIARNAYDLGQLRDAADGYERALELAHRIDSKFGQMRAPAYIALVLRDLGRYEEADRWCGLSIRLSEEAGFAEGLAIGLSCRAAIFNDTSAPDRAVKTARAARVVIPYLADYRIEVDCLVRLGEVEASAGDPARAMRSFDQALQIASQVTYRQGMARAHADRAAEQVRLGQYEEAIASCLSARAAMQHCDLLLVRAQLAVTEADIALAAGRCADAVAGYRQASAIYHCAGHRLAEVRTLLSWGHAAAMVPGYGRPGRSWRRALHIAGQMDVPEADIVRGLLGAPG